MPIQICSLPKYFPMIFCFHKCVCEARNPTFWVGFGGGMCFFSCLEYQAIS